MGPPPCHQATKAVGALPRARGRLRRATLWRANEGVQAAAGARAAERPHRPQRELQVAAALVERPAEQLLGALEAVEHGVLVRVQPLGGAARVPALLEPGEQRLAQPRGGRVVAVSGPRCG